MGAQGSTHVEVRFAYKISSDKLGNMYDVDVKVGIIREWRVKCRDLIYKLISFGTTQIALGTVGN